MRTLSEGDGLGPHVRTAGHEDGFERVRRGYGFDLFVNLKGEFSVGVMLVWEIRCGGMREAYRVGVKITPKIADGFSAHF